MNSATAPERPRSGVRRVVTSARCWRGRWAHDLRCSMSGERVRVNARSKPPSPSRDAAAGAVVAFRCVNIADLPINFDKPSAWKRLEKKPRVSLMKRNEGGSSPDRENLKVSRDRTINGFLLRIFHGCCVLRVK